MAGSKRDVRLDDRCLKWSPGRAGKERKPIPVPRRLAKTRQEKGRVGLVTEETDLHAFRLLSVLAV